MPVKTIIHPTTGRTFRLGRRQPAPGQNYPRLRDYLVGPQLPTPPEQCDYSGPAREALAQVYRNDVEGCCVVSGAGHIAGVLVANAGEPVPIFSGQEIDETYHDWGGFVPGDPSTDNGCDEITALNSWRKNGFCGHKIDGWLAVDATDKSHIQIAQSLFENLIFGVSLPDAWINPMPSASGFTWPEAGPPNPENGHCFIGFGYGSQGVRICTWGMTGTVSYESIAKYAAQANGGELYAVISQESLSRATRKAPAGVDWPALVADFNALGGDLDLVA